ncbi:MAG TPA: hypothetical protein VH157_13980 [Bryobacteraceae bacterium]|nr:hypothetical protein [Bryobacteraceae bacterium]
MNEGLDVAKPEETLPEVEPTTADQKLAPARTIPAISGPSWLRLAYSFEFLLATLVIFTLWSEIGGQGHLDLMPWYVKFACGLGTAWCSIRFTAGLVEESRAWNARSARWFSGLIAIAIVMGGITYYYHLQEAQDQPDTDDTQATSVKVANPPGGFYRASDRTSR